MTEHAVPDTAPNTADLFEIIRTTRSIRLAARRGNSRSNQPNPEPPFGKCPRRDRICVPRRLPMLPGYDPLDEVGANVNLAMRRSGRTRLAAGAESMTEIPRCRTVRF